MTLPSPIWIECEGGGGPAHQFLFGVVMCKMCGARMLSRDETMPAHDRQDILAMLDRGDFA